MNVKLGDIKKAVSDLLQANFPDCRVIAGEVIDSFPKPALFIEVLPVQTMKSQYFTMRTVAVQIRFYSRNDTDEENVEMSELLGDLFDQVLKVGDRFLTIEQTERTTEDRSLVFSFDLTYSNENDVPVGDPELGYTPETIETMQDLYLVTKGE